MEAALRRGSLDMRPDVEFSLRHLCGFDEEKARSIAAHPCQLVANVNRGLSPEYFKTVEPELMACSHGEQEKSVSSMLWAIYCHISVDFFRVGSTISYDHIAKIFPDQADPKNDAFEVLSFFSKIADKDTLTYIFIRGHGTQNGVGDFEYQELLQRIEKIPGKKVMVVLACHSGGLIEHLSGMDAFDDYVAITSTFGQDLATNWNDDEIEERITDRLIREGQPLSRFGEAGKIFMRSGIKDMQLAQAYLPFDVIL